MNLFEEERRRLLALLAAQSVEHRPVVLASGRNSNFYVDCKRTVLTAEGHWLVGRLLFALTKQVAPQAIGVGGMTMGADPLASAISLISHLAQQPLHAFYVRKEPKGHGTNRWIEGLFGLPPSARLAMVEDVVTTGNSTLKAIERVVEAGHVVEAVVAVVDRQEGGKEALKAQGYPLASLFLKSDFQK
ncbi:MAG: orotate phosphoribosyltransferase [Cystobacterineae bacterium]|nr:orotate phosphoribosyltransferase [Cystobacterineae bacterium]